ncbi:MAG: hypothetical protein ACI9DC_001623 [Gammaproteobacteria bacterium]|jgi:hypothetical protein
MGPQMDLTQLVALSMGAAWASGINLYAALLMLGLMGATGHMQLPSGMEILAEPPVLMAAGFMYFVEFFADKVPGVDNGWDTIHTFIRLPAGAVLAAAAVGDVSMAAQVSAAIVGGSLAGVTHATKAGSRVMVNTSPEPFTNWTVSLAEDVAVFAGLWAALNYPSAFLAALIVFVIVAIWLLPKIWRGVRGVFRRISNWLSPPAVADSSRTSDPSASGDSADSLQFTLGSSAPDSREK